MFEGKYSKGELNLYTCLHTSEDIDKLINILTNRYGFICRRRRLNMSIKKVIIE
jgi:hypothetical protein